MDIQHAFEAIAEEREYQDKTWPNSKKLPVTGEILLLEEYLNKFRQHYQEEDDGDDIDVPEVCLHDLRKMATILVRAMVNGGVRYRDEIEDE
jgi:hypothetical protein